MTRDAMSELRTAQSEYASSASQQVPIRPFESDIFADHPRARFAIGVIAVGSEVMDGCEEEYLHYLRLRADVYRKRNYISEEAVRSDGTEMDEDDARSVHIAVFEQVPGGVAAVGTMRLIVKSEADNRPLPVEGFFEDAFADEPAGLHSTEASRYTSIARRAAGDRVQVLVSNMLLAQGTAYIVQHNLGPTYATAEQSLEQLFAKKNVPFSRLSEHREVPEYNDTVNACIQIDTTTYARLIESLQPGLLREMQENEGVRFTYFGHTAIHGTGPVIAPGVLPVNEAAA